MVPANSFIIHEKFPNLPDMPGACRMKICLIEAEKFQKMETRVYTRKAVSICQN